MDDRNQEVFRRYDIKVYTTYKARGAVVLETDRGLLLLKSFEGSMARVEFENAVKEFLIQKGYANVDLYLRNMDGELITEDYIGNKYVLKNWFVGEECNLKETSDVMNATTNLASMHTLMVDMPVEEEIEASNLQPNLFDTYEKRNRELKRVRAYIKDKRQKNEFEMCYLNNYEKFAQQGIKALQILKDSRYLELYEDAKKHCQLYHGNYTYHNVMMLRGNQPASTYEMRGKGKSRYLQEDLSLAAAQLSQGSREVAATNFDKVGVGLQVFDLYHFLRKALEKNDWDIDYGSMLIEQYNQTKELSLDELKVLYVMLLYPEKFWKITNFYYNSKKTWVPQRNIQKLMGIQEQYGLKEKFLNHFSLMVGI